MTTKSKAPTKKPAIRRVHIYTFLKKSLPLLAAEFEIMDASGQATIEQPVATKLSRLLAQVPSETRDVVDSALSSAIGDIRRIVERLIVRLKQDSIERDLMPLAAYLMQEFKRTGGKWTMEMKPSKRRATIKPTKTVR